MNQITQKYRTGELRIEQVPAPLCRPGGVLVHTAYSLVSSGTELMKVRQARMSLLEKARARPDKVRQVLESVRQNGVQATVQRVRERLNALTPLGYSLAGHVAEIGAGLDEFQLRQPVACAGEGIACHAEYVFVPRNLCVPVPEGVALKDAAFATVGAIALNGVRQANVSVGDTVLVIGLGLVGLLGVQILKAAGCRVIGVDLNAARVEIARVCGADAAFVSTTQQVGDAVANLTQGRGADAAYIAASTDSNDPMTLAGECLRDRGTVVVVGMVPLAADWNTFYRKELRLLMARSYGPGRYDPAYEQRGIDYPVGYVPRTQRRNLAEFLRLIGDGRVTPSKLDPEVIPFDQAPDTYRRMHEGGVKGSGAMLFEYPVGPASGPVVGDPASRPVFGGAGLRARPLGTTSSHHSANGARVRIAVIGAGNFATGTLIPSLKKIKAAELVTVVSARGLTARSAAQRHGFAECDSDALGVFARDDVDAVVIATRHDSHAPLAAAALEAGKAVFVEKPLAMNMEQLQQLMKVQGRVGGLLVPGFNRRFSPLSIAVRDLFTGPGGLSMLCRVNAGSLAGDSWYRDDAEGGWRIISEGCHFIDLMQYLCGAPPVSVQTAMLGGDTPGGQRDTCHVVVRFANGSIGTLMYTATGDPRLPKERVEVFGHGRAAVIDNFHQATLWPGGSGRKRVISARGKGHDEELAAFVATVSGAPGVQLPLSEAVAATLATFAAVEAARTGRSIALDELEATPAPPEAPPQNGHGPATHATLVVRKEYA